MPPLAPLAILGPEEPEFEGRAELVAAVRSALGAWGLQVEEVGANSEGKTQANQGKERLVLLISMSIKQLCYEAEQADLLKDLRKELSLKKGDVLRFVEPGTEQEHSMTEFRMADISDFDGFSSSSADTFSAENFSPSFFQPWELLILVQNRLAKVESNSCSVIKAPRHGEPLVDALIREAGFEGLQPLHTSKPSACFDFPCSHKGLHHIHSYYGDGIAAYFVFMRTFTLWLVPLAVMALILKVFRPPGSSVDTSTRVPLYELAVVLWSAAFPSLLNRADAHFACIWGRLEAEENKLPRPEYTGDLQMSPITGKQELFYPNWKRWLKYVGSAVVTGAMLLVAFTVMIISLNFQGYIHNPKLSAARGLEATYGSPFLVEPIAALTEPGKIFDPTGAGDPFLLGYITLVPVIVHSIVINFLNKQYRNIATALTSWENHRTQEDFENAMILKRFFFEAFDSYIALFYIAFYERDVKNLRSELVSLFQVDVFRRLVLETLLPLATQHYSRLKEEYSYAQQKKNDEDEITHKVVPKKDFIEEQLTWEEHEEFDEYLEMVITFGYVVLFAGCFPIASFLTMLTNIVEVYSDHFKLRRAYKRPVAYATNGMPEMWHFIANCLCWMCVLTNVLAFGYITEQAMHLIPNKKLFRHGHEQFHDHKVKTLGVWMLFALENVLLIAATAIRHAVQKQPPWVRQALAGREYRRVQIAKATLQSVASD